MTLALAVRGRVTLAGTAPSGLPLPQSSGELRQPSTDCHASLGFLCPPLSAPASLPSLLGGENGASFALSNALFAQGEQFLQSQRSCAHPARPSLVQTAAHVFGKGSAGPCFGELKKKISSTTSSRGSVELLLAPCRCSSPWYHPADTLVSK